MNITPHLESQGHTLETVLEKVTDEQLRALFAMDGCRSFNHVVINDLGKEITVFAEYAPSEKPDLPDLYGHVDACLGALDLGFAPVRFPLMEHDHTQLLTGNGALRLYIDYGPLYGISKAVKEAPNRSSCEFPGTLAALELIESVLKPMGCICRPISRACSFGKKLVKDGFYALSGIGYKL